MNFNTITTKKACATSLRCLCVPCALGEPCVENLERRSPTPGDASGLGDVIQYRDHSEHRVPRDGPVAEVPPSVREALVNPGALKPNFRAAAKNKAPYQYVTGVSRNTGKSPGDGAN